MPDSRERDLVLAAAGGSAEACRGLVEVFLPAIANLARGFQRSRVEQRELMQEGVAGLLFAARRFDPKLGTPFWAYASFWVRKAMQELVAELTRPMALSDRAMRDLARIRDARHEHVRRCGAEPSAEQLSAAVGLTVSQLESLLAAEHRSVSEAADTVADPTAELAYEQVLDRLEIRRARDLTEQLDDRERAIVRAHYGLGTEAQTLGQIGDAMGLTAERARQIEVAALAKLRATLTRAAPVGRAEI